MATYMSIVKVRDRVQNAQKLFSIWGEIRSDLQDINVELMQSFAILGEYDFLLLFDAPDRDAAFKTAFIVENYGLDMQTMEIIPVEELAPLVNE